MKNRNYGIDFLRIVLMCIVVTMHILGHGGSYCGDRTYESALDCVVLGN